MNAAQAFVAPLRWLGAAVARWRWRHLAWSLAAATLFAINVGQIPDALDAAWAFVWVYNVPQFGLPFVFALLVADAAIDDGMPPIAAYGSAVLVVALVGVFVLGPLLFEPMNALFAPLGVTSPTQDGQDLPVDFDVRLFAMRLLPMLLVTTGYAQYRGEQRTVQRLRAGEVERAEASRRVQSAKLLALQARFEPQLVFDALRQVRDRIAVSGSAAEPLLADLITLLRAAQRGASSPVSTVRREFELARAHARVSQAVSSSPLRLVLPDGDDIPPNARLAALWLLPTLRRLAASAPGAGWTVRARAADGRLGLDLEATDVDAAGRAAIAALDPAPLQTPLRALHGDDVSLVLDVDAPAPVALRVDLPLACDDSDDDDHGDDARARTDR
jgi:hypothetical protein